MQLGSRRCMQPGFELLLRAPQGTVFSAQTSHPKQLMTFRERGEGRVPSQATHNMQGRQGRVQSITNETPAVWPAPKGDCTGTVPGPSATYRREAAKVNRTIPIVQLTPANHY
jgi:hypothetical protein